MQKQKAQQENAIIEGVIWKQLLIFFFPILLGSFFQQMYNTADTIIVGQFAGKLALAAVGSTGSYVNLLFGFFVGLASGATVILAQFFGGRNAQGVHDSVHTAMALSLLAGLAVTIAGLLTSKLALDLMNVPENIYDDALIYLQIFFLGMIPLVVYNVGAGILRAVGDSKSPLYFLIASCLINVVLDLLFVAVWRGGAAGAAIATVISEAISAAMVTVALMRRKDSSHLALREIRISRPILKDTLAIGIPGGLQAVMYSVSNMIVQTVVNGFGSDSGGGLDRQFPHGRHYLAGNGRFRYSHYHLRRPEFRRPALRPHAEERSGMHGHGGGLHRPAQRADRGLRAKSDDAVHSGRGRAGHWRSDHSQHRPLLLRLCLRGNSQRRHSRHGGFRAPGDHSGPVYLPFPGNLGHCLPENGAGHSSRRTGVLRLLDADFHRVCDLLSAGQLAEAANLRDGLRTGGKKGQNLIFYAKQCLTNPVSVDKINVLSARLGPNAKRDSFFMIHSDSDRKGSCAGKV